MLPIKASHAEKHFTPTARCSSEEGGFVCELLIVFTSNFSRSGFWGGFFFFKFSPIWKPMFPNGVELTAKTPLWHFIKGKRTNKPRVLHFIIKV